ncbi:hypothetical protein OV090_29825 [Nannocystis sp. RBIL2]|uniref:hypothetical protein n=1 Tax=Nannocystis sp. RBIL2 TaxID=2996788 RepID=UPI002271A176|nr:hypothetical protein [Nannocystis sp. RBIL2]MCY1068975.1 hypothetical protein [Nannocystis sp. RBIL2]
MRHVAKAMLCGLLFGSAALSACFNAPSDPVQFSCEPDDAAECPAGYECRIDGCCHREDTPDDDSVGACKLGATGANSGDPPPPPAQTTTGTSTDSDGTASATDATGVTTTTGATSTGGDDTGDTTS